MAEQPKCPKCGSVIYSRRNPVCGCCGEKLPESLMFDPATRKKIDGELARERKRREWDSKFPGQPSSSGEFGPML